MDFTTLLDLILKSVTKSQVESLFNRLNIISYTDFEVFLTWLFLAIVIDLIVIILLIWLIKWLLSKINGGFDL